MDMPARSCIFVYHMGSINEVVAWIELLNLWTAFHTFESRLVAQVWRGLFLGVGDSSSHGKGRVLGSCRVSFRWFGDEVVRTGSAFLCRGCFWAVPYEPPEQNSYGTAQKPPLHSKCRQPPLILNRFKRFNGNPNNYFWILPGRIHMGQLKNPPNTQNPDNLRSFWTD